MLLFVKEYDPFTERLSFRGHFHIPRSTKLQVWQSNGLVPGVTSVHSGGVDVGKWEIRIQAIVPEATMQCSAVWGCGNWVGHVHELGLIVVLVPLRSCLFLVLVHAACKASCCCTR